MTTKCLYPYCQDSVKNPDENYFHVPDEPVLRAKWMSAIPQVLNLTREAVSGKQAFLCSKHFPKANFYIDDQGKIQGMKKDAIPSIFYVPSNDEEKEGGVTEEVSDVDIPPPPAIPASMSNILLYSKAHSELLKVFIIREKLEKEEKELEKIQKELSLVDKNTKTEEVQDAYLRLMKKMRPIAPKKPARKRTKYLEEVIVYMRKERLLSEEASLVILHLFADIILTPGEDTPAPLVKEGLSCFAQYLTYYSTEVYENISSTFELTLPSISSVRKIFNSSQGEPGWSCEAFDGLKERASKSGKLLCALLVGSTTIRRKEEWDGKKMRGYVDCGLTSSSGFNADSDGLPSARSALVLMVVPLESQKLWRVPVAYFYINMLTSSEKANVIRECILRLHAVDSVVLSVTCDVSCSDKIFLKSLGVSYDLVSQICPYFVHPGDPLLRVHLVIDHCSLMTSVQNFWSTSQNFQDFEDKVVSWKYVSEFIKLQEIQAGNFAQTYDSPEWCWDPSYIRNRLMAQLFSDTTADAMEYCWSVLKLEQFNGCEGTVYFIRMMSLASKLLNRRRYLKTRPTSQDEASLRSDYLKVLDYLYHLRDIKEEPLHSAKTGSIRLLYQTLLSCQELLRQVPEFSSHCVSLDEVELMFYIIRTYSGWSTAPTARQFTAAFTKHVEKHGYFDSWNLCQSNRHWWIDSSDVSRARRQGHLGSEPKLNKQCVPTNCDTQISPEHLHPRAEFKTFTSTNFIAVCIVKNLVHALHCEACIDALQDAPPADNPLLSVLRKTCGAVLCPSQGVLRICASSERHLQPALKSLKPKLRASIFEWEDDTFVMDIGTAVVRDVQGKDIFPSLKNHHLECAPNTSHLYRLIKGISYCYVCQRLRNMKSWCPT